MSRDRRRSWEMHGVPAWVVILGASLVAVVLVALELVFEATRTQIGITIVLLSVVLAGAGALLLWMPVPREPGDGRREIETDVGKALLVGALVSLTGAFLAFQQDRLDDKQSAERRELDRRAELQRRLDEFLASREDLTGVDLSDRDLRGTFLVALPVGGEGEPTLPPVRPRGSTECTTIAASDVGAGRRLADANLGSSNLANANLQRADLEGANLVGSDLTNASLERGRPRRGAARHRNAARGDPDRSRLADASLVEANAVDARLSNADIGGASFRGADLRRAKLVCVDASERPVDVARADLWEANPRCANLATSRLKEARLERAEADSETAFPQGFDAERAGVVLTTEGRSCR